MRSLGHSVPISVFFISNMAAYIHARITLTFLPLQFFKCKFETFLMGVGPLTTMRPVQKELRNWTLFQMEKELQAYLVPFFNDTL